MYLQRGNQLAIVLHPRVSGAANPTSTTSTTCTSTALHQFPAPSTCSAWRQRGVSRRGKKDVMTWSPLGDAPTGVRGMTYLIVVQDNVQLPSEVCILERDQAETLQATLLMVDYDCAVNDLGTLRRVASEYDSPVSRRGCRLSASHVVAVRFDNHAGEATKRTIEPLQSYCLTSLPLNPRMRRGFQASTVDDAPLRCSIHRSLTLLRAMLAPSAYPTVDAGSLGGGVQVRVGAVWRAGEVELTLMRQIRTRPWQWRGIGLWVALGTAVLPPRESCMSVKVGG
ncbi:hypothetical protein LXA43DRAFT_1060706 [Ganoderma leucocontextum]|nr:hypothetical protein LXA43DRAFT_1060706 [Ganoderma leucocontextum]